MTKASVHADPIWPATGRAITLAGRVVDVVVIVVGGKVVVVVGRVVEVEVVVVVGDCVVLVGGSEVLVGEMDELLVVVGVVEEEDCEVLADSLVVDPVVVGSSVVLPVQPAAMIARASRAATVRESAGLCMVA